MSNFLKILKQLTESESKVDSVTSILSKYGKVISKEIQDGRSIRLTVDLGSDEDKAIKDIRSFHDSTGRANTHLLNNGKSYTAEVIIDNPNYKQPPKKELSATEKQRWAIYGGDPDKNPSGLGT